MHTMHHKPATRIDVGRNLPTLRVASTDAASETRWDGTKKCLQMCTPRGVLPMLRTIPTSTAGLGSVHAVAQVVSPVSVAAADV